MHWRITLWELFFLGSSFNCRGAVVMVRASTLQLVGLGSIRLSNHTEDYKIRIQRSLALHMKMIYSTVFLKNVRALQYIFVAVKNALKTPRKTNNSNNKLYCVAVADTLKDVFFCIVLFIFILHSRESELYRYILDGKSALAWELPFPRCLGHLSST